MQRRSFLTMLGAFLAANAASGDATASDFEPDNGEIKVTGYRAEDTDERAVEVDIHTDASEPRLSMKQILSPEQARQVARRLEAAAEVADGAQE